jgi:hypothetical protein
LFRRKYRFLRGGPITSDEGFTVSFEGRTRVIYEDEQGKVIISGEQLADVSNWVLYANRIYVGPDVQQKLESDERKALIVKRVVAAGEFQGIKIDVDRLD